MGLSRFVLLALLVVISSSAGRAEAKYPDRPIRLIFGFPAGNDIVARIYAEKLAESLGQPVVIDNVSGAAGNIAADRVAKAIPDGYTIGVLASANIVINPSLYNRLPYDPVRDLVPVSQIYTYPNILLINNQVPAKTVGELLTFARSSSGKLTYGHSGPGTTTHLSGELLKFVAHVDLQDVPYRGPSAVLSDLLNGTITMAFSTPSVSLPLVQENKIRALAVTSRTRAPFAPNLPTMGESGFPEVETIVWFGLFLPAGTPASIVDILNRETSRIMKSTEVVTKVLELGQVPIGNSQEEFNRIIKSDIPYWSSVIEKAQIRKVD